MQQQGEMDPTSPLYGPPWCLSSQESTCNAGDAGSIPGQEDPLEKGDGNALQYSCWEDCNPWCRKRIGHDLVTKQQHQ